MVDRTVEIRVGIVIVVALVLLVSGLLWLTETRVRDTGYSIDVAFPSVSGLKKGDAVTIGGVEQGNVRGVTLRPQDVLTTLWLTRDAKVRRDAKISIESQGMMGEKYVAIEMGHSTDVVQPGEVVAGSYSAGLPEATAQISDVLASLQRILNNLEGVVGDEEFRESVRSAARSTSSAMMSADSLVRDVRPAAMQASRDLSVAAHDLRALLEENREGLSGGIQSAGRTFARLDTLTTLLASATEGLNRVMARIDAGEGTLGKLSQSDSLHSDLSKAIKDMNQLILDIRANPKKYISVSVF